MQKFWANHWEWVFFKNLIGAIIFFPVVKRFLFLLAENHNMALILATSFGSFFVCWLYSLKKKDYLLPLTLALFLTAILFGWSVQLTNPILVVWFVSVALTVVIFGLIAARHLFGQTEKLFVKKWKEVIVFGVASNLLKLLFALSFVVFPLPLMVLVIGVLFMMVVAHCADFA